MSQILKHIILCVLMMPPVYFDAQTVLIKQTVPKDYSEIDDGFGPNRKHFSYPYFGIGFISEGYSHEKDTIISPNYFRSTEFRFGTRTRLKLNNLLAFGNDFELGISSYSINLKDDYAVANYSPDVSKAKYQLYNVGGASYFQFNFEPKRGNQLGCYLDLGVYGGFNFGRRFTQTIKNGKERTEYTLKRLQNFEKWYYGAIARFGKNNWAVFAKYRYSNSFKDKATIGNYELPRLTFGFEFFPGNI